MSFFDEQTAKQEAIEQAQAAQTPQPQQPEAPRKAAPTRQPDRESQKDKEEEARHRAKSRLKIAAACPDFHPQFLWYPYIPLNEYTVILAESGIGKTMLCCGIAAAISNGSALPADNVKHFPANVLFISSEDESGALKERLEKSGADLNRVYIIDCSDSIGMNFAEDIAELKAAIEEAQAKLVILDPWQAFTGEKVNLNHMNQTRPLVQRLSQLAKQTHCAIVLISHVNKKAQSENANNAAAGSGELINAARSAIKIEYENDPNTEDGEGKNIRLLIHTKSNHAALGKTVRYNVGGGCTKWAGFSEIDRSTIELAARRKLTTYEALQQQQKANTDFSRLVSAINERYREVFAEKKVHEIRMTYQEIEDASPYKSEIWNGHGKQSGAVSHVRDTMRERYNFDVLIPSGTVRSTMTGRTGRGIIVKFIDVQEPDEAEAKSETETK